MMSHIRSLLSLVAIACCLGAVWAESCSLPHEDCSHTACCVTQGHQCYRKNANFSGCRAGCSPGLLVGDPVRLLTPWSCQPVSKQQEICSLPHEDCSHTACCATQGQRCYKKNEMFSGCRATCTPGLHDGDPEQYRTPWSCELADNQRPHCADDNSDCVDLGCCKTQGHKCFMKTLSTAFCKAWPNQLDGWATKSDRIAPGLMPGAPIVPTTTVIACIWVAARQWATNAL